MTWAPVFRDVGRTQYCQATMLAILASVDRKVSEPIRRLQLSSLEYPIYLLGTTFTYARTVVPVYIIGPLATSIMHQQSIFQATNRVSFALMALAVTDIVVQTTKRMTQRERPKHDTSVERIFDLRREIKDKGNYESFPSGDTAAGAAWCSALAVLTGNPLWRVVAIGVGFARVYFHCHWVFDTVAGGTWGLIVPILLDMLCPWQAFNARHILVGTLVYVLYRHWLINRVVQLVVNYDPK